MSDVLPESEFTPPRRGWPYVKIGLAVVGLLMVALLANHLQWLYQLRSARAILASSGYNLIFERRPELGITQIDDFLAEIYPNSLVVTEKSPMKPQAFPTACETPLFRNAGMIHVIDCTLSRFTDEQAALIAAMSNLQSLEFNGQDLTESGAARLRGLTQLQTLTIRSPGFTDHEFEWIKDCRSLWHLRLSASQVSDQAAAWIAHCQNIEVLDLSCTQITSVGCAELAKLSELRTLDLSQTKITSLACAELAKLPNLRYLDLSGTLVDDTLSEHIGRMKELTVIRLVNTNIGIRTCKTLATLPYLVEVDLRGCSVSETELAAFKRPKTELQTRVLINHSELAEVTP